MKTSLRKSRTFVLLVGLNIAAMSCVYGCNNNGSPTDPTLMSKSTIPPVRQVVQAENCSKKRGWQAWDSGAFSGGRLLHSEAFPGAGYAADFSQIVLTFQGRGIEVIYRQDTWYGTLAVMIDGVRVGVINQKGQTANKRLSQYFTTGGTASHTLVLRGKRATGVVSVDAIRIH